MMNELIIKADDEDRLTEDGRTCCDWCDAAGIHVTAHPTDSAQTEFSCEIHFQNWVAPLLSEVR